MKNRKRCVGCGGELLNRKPVKLCDECRELTAIGKNNPDLFEFERLRAKHNNRHSVSKSYGQFVQYIEDIFRRSKK